jgi:glutamine synthetase
MTHDTDSGPLSLEALRAAVERGEIDTVVLGMVDMQGRLQGKRLTARHFIDEIVEARAQGCNYQLSTDIEMTPVQGYRHASWSSGYGDFAYHPDLSSLRLLPWHPGSAFVMADLEWEDGSPVAVSPRQILRVQMERLAEHGLYAYAGTELEFLVFNETFREAWDKGYRDLTPATRYNVDYSLLDTDRLEPLLRRIRNSMQGAGLTVQDSKGETNHGHHEINFGFGPVLNTADEHAIYKNGAKEIAAQAGYSLTYMAKFNERDGSSCHIHLSLRTASGDAVMADGHELSTLGQQFVAGILAAMRELTLFFAPNINSYKRYVPGSFAPTVVTWGRDNRTCALRLVGQDKSLRIENRVPGGDVNPYLALAAMIAGGLHGIDNELALENELAGNAYESGKPHVPATLRDARDLFEHSEIARKAFGDPVVDHYVHMANTELQAFDTAITDWERYRVFERM